MKLCTADGYTCTTEGETLTPAPTAIATSADWAPPGYESVTTTTSETPPLGPATYATCPGAERNGLGGDPALGSRPPATLIWYGGKPPEIVISAEPSGGTTAGTAAKTSGASPASCGALVVGTPGNDRLQA